MQINKFMFDGVRHAYLTMAMRFQYRPARIEPVPNPSQEEMAEEINDYVESWFTDEGSQRYFAGCPDGEDRETLIYIIEAARCLNGIQRQTAHELLLYAAQQLAP